jgi:hypothetical protein
MIGTVRIPMVCALLLLPGVLLPSERFDGKWLATVTCPAKGKTLGYKIEVPSVIKDGNFRGERGAAGEPGYLLIEGKIADKRLRQARGHGQGQLQGIRHWSLYHAGLGL